MIREGLEWTLFDTPLSLEEVTAPTVIPDNTLKLYAKDKAGVSALYYKGDDEVEHDLSLTPITGSGAAGQVAFFNGATSITGENNLFWDATNNRLGVGSATPLSDLEVVTTGSALPRGIAQTQYSGDGNAPGIQLRKARGTEALPTVALLDDPLGEINFFGYTGSAFTRTAIIQGKAAENYSGTNQGSYLRFFTIPIGSTTLTEQVRIKDDGTINVTNLTASQFVTTDASKNLVSVDHVGAADPHTGYRLESADHSHQSMGLQAGQLDHGLALTGLSDDDHSQYALFAFKTIVVSGQSDVVADARDDTLNLVAGTNITLTTSAAGDSVTIAASGGVTDHGALTGLSDDDHSQYLLLAGRATTTNNPIISTGTTGIITGSTQTNGELKFVTTTNASRGSFAFRGGLTADFTPNTFIHVKAGAAKIKLESDGTDGGASKTWLLGTAIFGPDACAGLGLESNHDGCLAAYNREILRFGGSSSTLLNIIIGGADTNNSASPSSGRGCLIFANDTALGTLAANTAGIYTADITAGNSAIHAKSEAGDLIKLYKVATYTPSNVTTDRSFDADTVAIAELADVVGTLIADLQTLGFLG